jgi:iron complex outermembrane receptor protein
MTIQRLLARWVGFILLCVLFTQNAYSQNKTITGKVSDDKGAPVAGASVTVKGTKNGVNTNADGAFTISVSPTATTLVFSSVGFTSQEISIGGQTNITVALATTSSNLNEVVVVGYGTVRKKDVTGSVASVQAKDFNQGTITSPDQLLQNKVAGLEITNNSGQPGSATTIVIRGNNSLRSANNPLYVVDGVALDGRTAKPELDLGKGGLPFGATPESNPLLYINPADIQQIDVLKDASATAIYGSRGANGIIIITTKKASANGTKVDVGANWGMFAGYMKNYGILSTSEFRGALKLDTSLAKFDAGGSANALSAITQKGAVAQNYSFGFSGGNENGKYRASFLVSNTPGFIKKTGLEKYLGNFGGNYKFLDKRISLDFDVIAGHTTEHMGLITNTTGANGSLMSWALNWNPTINLKQPNGLYTNDQAADYSIPNPLAVIDAYNDIANVNTFLANVGVTVNIVKGLDYKFLYAINHGTGSRKTSFDGWVQGVQTISTQGMAAISNATLTSQTFTHTLNYHLDLTSDFRMDVVGGYEYFKTDYATSTTAGRGFNINEDQATRTEVPLYDFLINASALAPIIQTVDPTAEIQSYFGRVNFNLKDKYYLTGTVRDDGSNKFGSNNRYGVFPSFGAKWNIANEEFMKNSQLFSQLALRGSWGITGNQEFPSGASLAQISSTAYNYAGQTNVANPDLKWEKTTGTDIGLDFALLNNRIYGSIDYYHKNTTDVLFQNTAIQPAPASIYFINLPANLINKGIEFTVGANVVSHKDFSWDVNFNFSYNDNKLTKFNQALIQTGAVSGQGVSGVFAEAITNNQPIDVYNLKPFQGYDKTGVQIIDSANKGAVFAGNPNPHTIIGFGTTLRQGKWTLGINAGGSFGFLIYNNTLNTITNINVITKGQNIAKSNLSTGESIQSGVAASTRYLESGNYFKLRNARLAYSFGNIGTSIKNLTAYVTGSNLFVITKFKGFDPEVNIDKNNNNYPSRSMEFLPYPTPRTISIGLNFGL